MPKNARNPRQPSLPQFTMTTRRATRNKQAQNKKTPVGAGAAAPRKRTGVRKRLRDIARKLSPKKAAKRAEPPAPAAETAVDAGYTCFA